MKFRCRICEQELLEQASRCTCTYCGQEEETDWSCPGGHYTCESCRTACPDDLTERTCLHSAARNPLELAELLMRHPAFHAYGEEHHSLAAPVILAALRNQGVPAVTDEGIRLSIARLKGIPISVCGTRGDCGAAASAGTVVAILRSATPLSDHERTEALRATAQTLLRIADRGGPRCCKQSVFEAILCTWERLQEELGLVALPAHSCSFAGKLKDCKTTRCPYFG
jgi:hypothetical protein